jgi:hypothetical protein
VSEYSAYLIGHDGHFGSSRSFVCGNDADATVWAQQLVDGHDVELWSGDRFVVRLKTDGKPEAASHEVIDGRMVPKKSKKPDNFK